MEGKLALIDVKKGNIDKNWPNGGSAPSRFDLYHSHLLIFVTSPSSQERHDKYEGTLHRLVDEEIRIMEEPNTNSRYCYDLRGN
jgi:hypothetical protein